LNAEQYFWFARKQTERRARVAMRKLLARITQHLTDIAIPERKSQTLKNQMSNVCKQNNNQW
jgi:hypothetical protein